jgi:hypothetical protein
MPRIYTAAQIITRAAVEVGLTPITDPVSASDENYVQMTALLNSAGQELVDLWPWQVLVKEYLLTTAAEDTGSYDLPPDFAYMIDQTGWDRSNDVPIAGPLSAQQWSYLKGRDLVSSTIYATFRLIEGKFNLFPQPPPVGVDVSFEYINRNWVKEAGGLAQDAVTLSSDFVLYEPILIIKFLKAKWLEAKGFDSSSARLEMDNMFQSLTGKDTGAQILSAGRNRGGYPYLSPLYNTPDSGYGP